jgi:AcrR family transcriptional regulator
MSGLRERQKDERQKRILETTRQQLQTADYRDVTIESIASIAGLSPMTVFNYYGSKGGLLLSLVAESDRQLIKKINKLLPLKHVDAYAAVFAFSQTIFDHAFSYLDRKTWGHVHATSILEGNSTFGRGFAELERELTQLLTSLLEELIQMNFVNPKCDTSIAATVIYNIHNARFIEFSSNLDVTRDQITALVENDLKFLMNLMVK